MDAAILSIGTELTRGELVNTNAHWLAEQLTLLGHRVVRMATVDDDAARIGEAVARLADQTAIVVSTGGLGPTTDDLTAIAVAQLLSVPLRRDPASLLAIEERMARFSRVMSASNQKQADFPLGSRVLPNPVGTAPGFAIEYGSARCFFLPGVPREMKHLFEFEVRPKIADLSTDSIVQIKLKTFGLPESQVNDKLAGVEEAFGVTLGYRAHFPEIQVKVLAQAETSAEAQVKAESAAARVRELLGSRFVYAEGDVSLPEAVGKLLTERDLVLGVIESCTGGLVAHLLTQHAGSSRYFAGAVVSYANQVKSELVGVDSELIAEHGAVSREVAVAMAQGGLERLGVDICLSLTGIAGPGGGSAEKPVGLVHYAVASRTAVTPKQLIFPGDRHQVQRIAAYAGLALVRQLLLEEGGELGGSGHGGGEHGGGEHGGGNPHAPTQMG